MTGGHDPPETLRHPGAREQITFFWDGFATAPSWRPRITAIRGGNNRVGCKPDSVEDGNLSWRGSYRPHSLLSTRTRFHLRIGKIDRASLWRLPI